MNILVHSGRYCLLWLLAASWQLMIVVSIVAALAWAARAASPRLRYGLWLLILLKVFLPPSLTAPWSIGRWIPPPLFIVAGPPTTDGSLWSPNRAIPQSAERSSNQASAPLFSDGQSVVAPLAMIAWIAGCLLFWLVVGWRYWQVSLSVRSASPIDEGPVRVAYEQIALDLALRRVPDLYVTNFQASPFLFSIVRPCIVLPRRWLADVNAVELRAVLTHELLHFKHLDPWVGWLQIVAQSLFWFHPLMWWANQQLRNQRECVCDEGVLRLGRITPQQYGESIVHVLTASRGQSLVAGSLVGIFERGAKLQDRLEDIMNYRPLERRFGWPSRLALAAVAILLLPMGRAVTSAEVESGAPQLVKTTPENGATGIDPALSEITVIFDRDMRKGMSWTGDGPQFPPLDEGRKAEWRDARACVLPVKLQPGSFYRVGINSTSFQNFKSVGGIPTPPSVISFTTKDAPADVQQQLRVPKVANLEPKNGAMDVDPKTDALKVTFDIPMGEGMSWTGGGELFPKLPEGKKPSWSADGMTCTLPVTLELGHDYQLGLNSARFKNFQSKDGVPLAPVVYKFRTRGK